MRIVWNPRHLIALIALVLAASAFAQAPAYERPDLGFKVGLPPGWTPSEEASPDGMLLLSFTAPSSQATVGLVATPISEADRAYWSGPRDGLVRDVWEGFLPELPGAQIAQSYEITVAGAQGSVIDYQSPNVSGSIVIVIGHRAAFTFFSVGDQASYEAAQGGLQALVGSFTFLGAPSGPTPVPGAAGGGGAPPMNPGGGSVPMNPGGGSAPTNPLGGGSAASTPGGQVGDPLVGVFADDRLQLTLTANANGLAGELVFDGARYPVIAQRKEGGVAGHFLAGGTSYPFDAQLAGDTMTFVTDDAQFVLQRLR